jgi:Flp pilus assembly protein TadB
MTSTSMIAGLCGAGVGVGIVLIVAGFRVPEPTSAAQPGRFVLWWVHCRERVTTGWLIGGLAAGLVAGLITGWVVGGVLVVVALWTLPRVFAGNTEQSNRVERIEGIAGWTETLRDTLVAAAGLEQAIVATAGTAPDAVRAEIRELAVRIERGDRLVAALRALADDLSDPTADLVVSALVLAAEHQARQLADLLGELANEAREQVTMRLHVEADRARSRTSVRVIVGTTVAFAVGLIGLNRGYLAPFGTALGQLVLLMVGGLFGLAFWWLARIVRPDGGQRILTHLASVGQDHAEAPR